jgi:hypothetical protein
LRVGGCAEAEEGRIVKAAMAATANDIKERIIEESSVFE